MWTATGGRGGGRVERERNVPHHLTSDANDNLLASPPEMPLPPLTGLPIRVLDILVRPS